MCSTPKSSLQKRTYKKELTKNPRTRRYTWLKTLLRRIFNKVTLDVILKIKFMKNRNLKYFSTSVLIEFFLLVIASVAIVQQSLFVALPGILIRWIIVIGLYTALYNKKLWAKIVLISLALLCSITGICFTVIKSNSLASMYPGLGVSILMIIQIFLLSRINTNEKESITISYTWFEPLRVPNKVSLDVLRIN